MTSNVLNQVMKSTEKIRHTLWGRLLSAVVFFVCIKLIFSILIKDNDEEVISPLKNLYYLADIPIFFLSCIYFLTSFKWFNQVYYLKVIKLLLLILCLILYAVITSMSQGIDGMIALTSQLKIFLPFLVLISFHLFPRSTEMSRSVSVVSVLVLLISLYAFIFLEPSRNRDAYYWPIYFSGLHTHAYVVFGTIVYFHFYFFSVLNRKLLVSILSLLFAVVLGYGYGVRTSLICFITYLLVFHAYHARWAILKKSNLIFVSAIMVVLILLIFAANFDVLTFDGFSSGRLSEYVSRFEFIRDRDFIGNAFGSGAGQDIMYSETWWWEDKGSHNDYLTLIIEFGFVYLMFFLYFIRKLFQLFSGNYVAYAVLSAYLVSSLISNGLMFRPLATYVLFLSFINMSIFYSKKNAVLTGQ